MLCAHTVRRLKPGTFDEFPAEKFQGPEEADAPAGWVRFHMLRSLADENDLVTFGFFDGRSRSWSAARATPTTRVAATRSTRLSTR